MLAEIANRRVPPLASEGLTISVLPLSKPAPLPLPPPLLPLSPPQAVSMRAAAALSAANPMTRLFTDFPFSLRIGGRPRRAGARSRRGERVSLWTWGRRLHGPRVQPLRWRSP